MRRRFSYLLAAPLLLVALIAGNPAALAATAAPATPTASAAPSTSASAAASKDSDDSGDTTPTIAKFTKGAEQQTGLFALYRKDGKVYAQIAPEQFDKDFLESIIPANGLGGYGFESGDVWAQPARIAHFVLEGKNVALVWPQTRFVAPSGTALATAINESTADSVEALLPVVAQDKGGPTLVDLSPLVGDTLGLEANLNDAVNDSGDGTYHFDAARSYFGPSKAFVDNVIIETEQTFASGKAPPIDTVVDARSIQFRVKYNFAAMLSSPDYMPRIGDDRVGFWTDPHIEFGHDSKRDPHMQYIVRWNIEASDTTKSISPARKPLVWYLDRSIPMEYRQPVREAILEWNKAFERIGISGALVVRDAPEDPNWDPDDVRYNVVRWITDADPAFGAEAQIIWDPRTGEIVRGGVLLGSYLVRDAKFNYEKYVAGLAQAHRHANAESTFGLGMMAQAHYGATALALMYPQRPVPDSFWRAFLKAVTLHEVGHDFGLSHNFIAHDAFTTKELQSRAFTQTHGVASSVMEYSPLNLWPKGTPQGDYFSPTIGPYDYHVIHWGYARIAGAKTPEEETPTLNRWASAATDPRYAFAGDEDAQYDGHAIDPRTAQFMLTNTPIDWCQTQLDLNRHFLQTLDSRFPQPQQPWDDERAAFGAILTHYVICADSMTHYIAGEYLSRARIGDSRAPATPLTPVPRSVEYRAFSIFSRYLLADDAWQLSPQTLRRLVYSEYPALSDFGYSESPRHDLPLSNVASDIVSAELNYLFTPLVLQRLEDMPYKTRPGETMTMADLFAWTQDAIFGDLENGRLPHTSIRRDLQRNYTRMLASMITAPWQGTPDDAQALARHELVALLSDVKHDLADTTIDLQSRAHLEALAVDINRALSAQVVIPAQ
ncbi:MAG TPA: zinc-dependent metalloprotease [Candidatus Baltobacteraceae bacterium]